MVANWNKARYTDDLTDWELNRPIGRLRGRANVLRTKPLFRHEENRVYALNDGKGGINWYRHQDEVLKPLLFLFAKECQRDRLGTVVIEDEASPHISYYLAKCYSHGRLREYYSVLTLLI